MCPDTLLRVIIPMGTQSVLRHWYLLLRTYNPHKCRMCPEKAGSSDLLTWVKWVELRRKRIGILSSRFIYLSSRGEWGFLILHFLVWVLLFTYCRTLTNFICFTCGEMANNFCVSWVGTVTYNNQEPVTLVLKGLAWQKRRKTDFKRDQVSKSHDRNSGIHCLRKTRKDTERT